MSRAQWLPAAGLALLLLLVPLALCLGLRDDPPPAKPHASQDDEAEETEVAQGGEAPSTLEEDATTEEAPGGVRTLRGRVVDVGDAPIEGAEVSIKDLRGHDVTNAEGRFLLASLPVRALTLIARAPGYAETFLQVGPGSAGDDQSFDVALEDGDTAAGIVIDGEGKRLKGAVVQCVDRETDALASDRLGRFELAEEAVGCSAVAHYGSLSSPKVILEAGPHNVLSLAPPATIAGVVVDSGDKPVTAFVVDIDSFRDAGGVTRPRPYHQTFSHPEGRFTVSNLAAGSYVLTISTRNAKVQTKALSVKSGETRGDVKVVVP